jgi:hypothetical protein
MGGRIDEKVASTCPADVAELVKHSIRDPIITGLNPYAGTNRE